MVEYLVCRGKVKPSTRAIRALGIGAEYVAQYIDRMAKRGSITKHGKGKTPTLVESRRIETPVDKFERLIAA